MYDPDGGKRRARRDAKAGTPTAAATPSPNAPEPSPTGGSGGRAPRPLIVVDAPNVAMRFGRGKFVVAGITAVVVHYQRRGHRVVAFLPETYVDREHVGGLRRMRKLGFEVSASKIPDDIPTLLKLVSKNLLVLTPQHVRVAHCLPAPPAPPAPLPRPRLAGPASRLYLRVRTARARHSQDYDDSYCIQHARKHDACIVSNDKYRDYVDKLEGAAKGEARRWVRAHRISYAFAGAEFLPNPDFRFPTPDPSARQPMQPPVAAPAPASTSAPAASGPAPAPVAAPPPAAPQPPAAARVAPPAVPIAAAPAPAHVLVQGGDMWGMPASGVAAATPAAVAGAGAGAGAGAPPTTGFGAAALPSLAANPVPPGVDAVAPPPGMATLGDVLGMHGAVPGAVVGDLGVVQGVQISPGAAGGAPDFDDDMADIMATAGLAHLLDDTGDDDGAGFASGTGAAGTGTAPRGGYFAGAFSTPMYGSAARAAPGLGGLPGGDWSAPGWQHHSATGSGAQWGAGVADSADVQALAWPNTPTGRGPRK